MKEIANIPLANIVFLSLWYVFSLPSYGNDITVVTEYLSPYQIKNDDGSLGGFATEVIHALFEITGDQPTLQIYPWARAYAIARHKKNTMIFSIAKTKSRLANFHWIGDLVYEEYYFWGLAINFDLTSLSLQQLKTYRIATSRGSNENEYLIEQEFNFIYPVANEEQRIQMLYKGRMDLIIETEITLRTITQKLKLNFSQLKKISFVNGLNTTLSIAFNINSDPNLVKKYQAAFIQLKQSGQLTKLQTKWQLPPIL